MQISTRLLRSRWFVLVRLTLAIALVLSLIAVPYRRHQARDAAPLAEVAATRYRVTEVKIPGYAGFSMAAVNDGGIVIGTAYNDSIESLRPFAWYNGDTYELPLPDGFIAGIATGINNKGQAVGVVLSEEMDFRGVVWDKKGMRLLTIDNADTTADAITDAGVVIGNHGPIPGHSEGGALLWQENKVRFLGEFIAVNGNEKGDVVGVKVAGQRFVAVRCRNGKTASLPLPKNYVGGVALRTNDRGVIGGAVLRDEESFFPAVWDGDGRTIKLLEDRLFGAVYGLTDAGQAVGYRVDAKERALPEGILWDGGKAIRLTDAVADKGWQILFATGVSRKGQIIGIGQRNGRMYPVLLTPTK
jgi:hypothetical protein